MANPKNINDLINELEKAKNFGDVQTTLESEAAKVNINMAFCSSEYKCAVLVQNFFPAEIDLHTL